MEEQDLEKLIIKYDDILQEYFVSNLAGEYGVDKDNFEDKYEAWIERLTESELNWIVSKNTIKNL